MMHRVNLPSCIFSVTLFLKIGMVRTLPCPVLHCSSLKQHFGIFINVNSPSEKNFKNKYYSHAIPFFPEKRKHYRKMQFVPVTATPCLNYSLGHKFLEDTNNVFSVSERSLGNSIMSASQWIYISFKFRNFLES